MIFGQVSVAVHAASSPSVSPVSASVVVANVNGELVHRVVVVLVLARVAARLGETRVDERAPGAGHVGGHPVEYAPPLDILVEALVDEVADHPAALRGAHGHRVLQHRPAAVEERIRRTRIVHWRVPCERDEVADGAEPQTQDDRVANLVDELVNRPRVGALRRRDGHGPVVRVVPLVLAHRLARIVLKLAVRQRCPGLLEGHRRIGEPSEGGAIRILPLLHGHAGNHPAVFRCRRQIGQHRTRIAAAGRAVQPAARHVGIARVHEQGVAGVLRRVGPPRLVEITKDDVAAAVVDLVHQHPVGLAHVHRLEDVELEGVLHEPVGVAGRVLEVDDAGVERRAGVGNGGRGAHQYLVGAHSTEGAAAERQLAAVDVDARDAGVRQRRLFGFRRRLLTGALAATQSDPEHDRQQPALKPHQSPPGRIISAGRRGTAAGW